MSKIGRIKEYFESSTRGVTIVLGGLKIAKAAVSFLVIVVSASYFGTSLERDSWVMAGALVLLFIQVFFGPLNETFRAKFIHIREEESEEKVRQLTNALVSVIIWVSIFICGILFLLNTQIAEWFAPGFSKPQLLIFAKMILILAPSLILLELVNIYSSILNAYRSFFLPDIFSLVSAFITILIVVTMANRVGIYSLIISSYIGSALLLFGLHYKLKNNYNFRFTLTFPYFKLILPFIVFALPLYVNYIFSQADIWIEKSLTTKMGVGSVSMLDYARKFAELPNGMIISVVTTVLTPILAVSFYKSQKEMLDETQKYFRLISFVSIPISVMLIVFSNDIIQFSLVRGKFTQELVPETASLLSWCGFGIFGNVFYIIYAQVLVAKKKIAVFSKIVIFTYIVKIVFNLLMYKKFGLLTFPISTLLSNIIMGGVMLFVSFPKDFKVVLKEASLITGLFALLWSSFSYYSSLHLFHTFLIFKIVINFALILIAEFLLILILPIEERNLLLSKIKSTFNKHGKEN